MQTHLAEQTDEVAWVAELFPEARDYLDTYEAAGLLGPGAVFGHAIHAFGGEGDDEQREGNHAHDDEQLLHRNSSRSTRLPDLAHNCLIDRATPISFGIMPHRHECGRGGAAPASAVTDAQKAGVHVPPFSTAREKGRRLAAGG